MSYTNHWTQIIRKLINEGHTKAELMKLSDEKLKDLHKEYSGKDDEDSQKEAEMIKDILDSRGDDGEEKKKIKMDEAYPTTYVPKPKPEPEPEPEPKPVKPKKKLSDYRSKPYPKLTEDKLPASRVHRRTQER